MSLDPKPRAQKTRGPRSRRGSLTVVGTGLAGPAHLTPEGLGEIRRAEKLFTLLADPLTRLWLAGIARRAQRPESLSDAYAPGKSRHRTYAEMVERILAEVRRGRRVVVALYGHPGVFAQPSHAAIRRARAEGYAARMLPAVSSEDCLYADLGVDPGEVGCQSFEATDFLLRGRRFDPTSVLVLWQIGVIGVEDVRPGRLWNRDGLAVLAERLLEHYPRRHEVVVYEASTLPVVEPKAARVALARLADAPVTLASTLYVPPVPSRATDRRIARRLAAGAGAG
jgi:precorrin-6B methylase 1